jgi:proline iminopeptidase
MSKDPITWLYPPIEPRRTGNLQVSELHAVAWEECGHPDGKPVVFLHGGPGGATSPNHRQYFDPQAYRIILFDQRGCGKSTPYAEIRENTTWDLVADIEKLRTHLGVDRWQVFGGSWGSTLGLAYAQRHPERVTELILRGIFLCSDWEVRWLYTDGASHLFPERHEEFLAPIPEVERGDLLQAYGRRLFSEDPAVNLPAAKAWSRYEGSILTLLPNPALLATFGQEDSTLAFARLECHYFLHKGWLEPDQLLRDVPRLEGIPATLVHGRYDLVCPFRNAWALHRAWPGSELLEVPDAGHSAGEPGISRALVAATDRYAGRPW